MKVLEQMSKMIVTKLDGLLRLGCKNCTILDSVPPNPLALVSAYRCSYIEEPVFSVICALLRFVSLDFGICW